jgi:hypothetical protein
MVGGTSTSCGVAGISKGNCVNAQWFSVTAPHRPDTISGTSIFAEGFLPSITIENCELTTENLTMTAM